MYLKYLKYLLDSFIKNYPFPNYFNNCFYKIKNYSFDQKNHQVNFKIIFYYLTNSILTI